MQRPRHRQVSLGDMALIVVGAFLYLRWAMSIGGFAGVGLVVLGLLVLGFAALRWGADSRDGFDATSGDARRAADQDRRAKRMNGLSSSRARG